MTGYMFATGQCYGCKQLFSFNPERVPSIPVNGVREPICRTCVDRVNPVRRQNGLAEIVPLPGAYEIATEDGEPCSLLRRQAG